MPSKEPDDHTKRVGALVRRFRDARDWKQEGLARRLNEAGWRPRATQPIVNRIEKGRRVLRPGEARILADVLGVPVSLLDRDRDPFGDDDAPYADEVDLQEYHLARIDGAREKLFRAAIAYRLAVNSFSEAYDAKRIASAATIARKGQDEADRMRSTGEGRIYG